PAIGEVTLAQLAGGGGVTVSLSSSDASAAAVPNSVFIAAGTRKASFPITTYDTVNTTTFVTITATAGINSGQATLKISPIVSDILFDPFDNGVTLFSFWDLP